MSTSVHSSALNKFVALIATIALLSGCLPTETPIPIITVVPGNAADNHAGFTGLTKAETVGPTKVKLSWELSSDPTVAVYNIYDSTIFSLPKLIKTVQAPGNSATILNLLTQNLYAFRVRAANAAGEEDANVKDLAAIPYGGVLSSQVLSSSTAKITYEDASNADSVATYCKTGGSPEFVLMRRNNVAAQTSMTLTGLVSGETYTCRTALTIGSTEDNNPALTEFTPIGKTTTLAFATQPGNSVAGQPLSAQPIVVMKDANGNIVTAGPDSAQPITLALDVGSPTAGNIRGSVTVNAVKGVATFTALNLQEAGIKIVTASKGDTSSLEYGSEAMSAVSDPFTISPAAVSATNSSILLDPAGPLVANGSAAYTVKIRLADAFNNPIPGVRPQFSSSNTNDTLTQPTTNTLPSGETTGSITSTVSGTRTLSIRSPSGLGAVTAPAVFSSGAASKLGFLQQPTNSPSGVGGISTVKVAVQDAQGNTVGGATNPITLSIFTNPGGGTFNGTATVAAVDGVATFTGIGIDRTGTGYKLVANAAPLVVAYSNAFNMTAGVPAKIAFTAVVPAILPTSVLAGVCSTAISIQLQDFGGNPANATANTNIALSGLGGGSFYTSSACAGAALGSTLTFTSGSNIKTLYYKNASAGPVTLRASDPANVMTAGTSNLAVNPSQLAMTGPTAVAAGRCSSGFILTTQGANSQPGPVSATTLVGVTGITGSHASLYTDSACSASVSPSAIPIASGASSTTVYVKDSVAETLTLTASDPANVMAISTNSISVVVGPSVLGFATSSSSVVAGTCSSAFNIQLKDSADNQVPTAAAKTLRINGLAGTQAAFYLSSSCAGAAVGNTFTIAAAGSSATLYLKDQSAETLSLFISDDASVLAPSATLAIGISPSAFRLTGPSPATSKTNECAGPFTVSLLDGLSAVTNAITTINATLGGKGSGGSFYSDSACSLEISGLQFTAGQGSKTVYFQGLTPANPPTTPGLTLSVTDAATVLTAATMTFKIVPDLGFLGSSGTLTWFEQGFAPVAARQNGHSGVYALNFDPTKRYLYVLDPSFHRVVKYDYLNRSLVGWIGRLNTSGSIGPSGSTINATLNSQCASMFPSQNGYQTPGWCLGGMSSNNSVMTSGNLENPRDLVDDGTYLYVTSENAHGIQRYDSATGAYAGWIGTVNDRNAGASNGSVTMAPAPGVSNSCATATLNAVTPGWCIGGRTAGRRRTTSETVNPPIRAF